MTIAYIFEKPIDARIAFREFVYENCDRVIRRDGDIEDRIVILDGDEHVFMTANEYCTWNLGRTYMLNGNLMHSNIRVSD